MIKLADAPRMPTISLGSVCSLIYFYPSKDYRQNDMHMLVFKTNSICQNGKANLSYRHDSRSVYLEHQRKCHSPVDLTLGSGVQVGPPKKILFIKMGKARGDLFLKSGVQMS